MNWWNQLNLILNSSVSLQNSWPSSSVWFADLAVRRSTQEAGFSLQQQTKESMHGARSDRVGQILFVDRRVLVASYAANRRSQPVMTTGKRAFLKSAFGSQYSWSLQENLCGGKFRSASLFVQQILALIYCFVVFLFSSRTHIESPFLWFH